MAAVITTNTGTVATKTLLVSTGTDLILPQYQYTSLLQGASATVTGSGTTALILGRVTSSHDSACEVDLVIDGSNVLQAAGGDQIIFRAVLGPGSHTVEFTGFALDNDVVAEIFGLTVIDLGL